MKMKEILIKFKEVLDGQKIAQKAKISIQNNCESIKELQVDFGRILQVALNVTQCLVQIGMKIFTIEISYD